MKNQENKFLTIVAALLLASSALISTFPLVFAHSPPWNCPTYAYLSVSPAIVGVNQYCTVVMWLNVVPTTATGLGGDRWRGYTVAVTAPDGTKTTLGPFESDQLGGAYTRFTPTQTGSYTLVFSWPGQTLTNGTGAPNTINIEYVGDYFMASTSDPVTLQVQQNPVALWQEAPVPLPTEYWTRPLNVQNRGWATLASNYLSGTWLRNSHFQEWGTSPTSPHILWTKPIYQYGGIADGRYGAIKIGPKDYENFMQSGTAGWPIVMNGKIYYNSYIYPWYGYYCVDLKTGETDWFKNGTDNGLNNPTTLIGSYGRGEVYPQLSFGQLYSYYGINGAGVIPYLWITQSGTPQTARSGGTMWHMIDAMTGNWILSLKNVPGGTMATDEQGDILLYSYNRNTGNFLCWNSSQSIPPLAPTGTNQQQWKPRTGAVIDAVNDTTWTAIGPSSPAGGVVTTTNDILPRSGYTMNVTIQAGLPSDFIHILQDKNMVPKQIVLYNFPDNFVNGVRTSSGLPTSKGYFQMAVLDIKKDGPYSPFPTATNTQNTNLGFSLNLLWNKTIPYPLATGNCTFYIGGSTTLTKAQLMDYDNQVFCLWNQELRQYYGYSLKDGSLLWGPTASTLPMDYYAYGGYQMDTPAYFGYGMLFNAGYGGDLIAYNITTGKQLWTYNATNVGYESPYGANYPLLTATIANGILYEVSGEHSATQPMWRGSHIRAINATNGELIWKLGYFPLGNNDRWLAVADGYIVAPNEYDGQLYCIGIGPSATTVSAPQNGIPLGSSFTVSGTVLDASPGTKNPTQKALFPNGVPAVSEASQEEFMEYLYEQQPKPASATGVPVSIDAIDPNRNLVHIGDATSDSSGFYCLGVNTNILGAGPGIYKVVATFAGSNSYAPSSAECAFTLYSTSAGPSPSPSMATPTINPPASPTIPAPTSTSSPSPSQAPAPAAADMTTIYAAATALTVIVVVAAAALVLRKRK